MGAAAIPIISAIGLAASVGSSVYSGVTAADAQDKQNAANAKAQADADTQIQLQKDQAAKQEQAQADAQSQADSANAQSAQLARQRAQQAGAITGRGSTILTSPLGIPNQPTAPGKTLLGS